MSTKQPAHATGFAIPEGGNRLDRKLFVVGNEVTVKISSADTGGAFTVCEDVTPPLAGPPLHLHHDQWRVTIYSRWTGSSSGRQLVRRCSLVVARAHASKRRDEPGTNIGHYRPRWARRVFRGTERDVPRRSASGSAKTRDPVPEARIGIARTAHRCTVRGTRPSIPR